MSRGTEERLSFYSVDTPSVYIGQWKRHEIPAMLRAAGKCGLTMTVDRRHPDPEIEGQ